MLSIALGMALVAGFSAYWTDSEMWAVAAAKYLFSPERHEYYFGTKPLFHFLLFLDHLPARALGLHPMDVGRAWAALNGLGLSAAVFLLLRRHGSLDRAVAGVAFLLALSTYVKRAGEMRSDILAAHALLWAAYAWTTDARARRWLVPALAAIAGLLTPKAALWCLCLLPLVRPSRRIVLGGLAAASVTLLTAFLFPVALRPVYDPLAFFLRSFRTEEVGFAYFSWERWEYPIALARENPHLVVFGLGALALWIRDRRAQSEISRGFLWSGIAFLALLSFYPDRLPFMIAAVLPFLVLPIFLVSPARRLRPELRTLVVCAGFLYTLHLTLLATRTHSSGPQRFFAFWLQKRIDELPPIEIYDPVGILPRTDAHYWFLGPGQEEKNRYVMTYIRQRQPEMMLFASKLEFLQPEIDEYLSEHYEGDQAGLFIRKLVIVKPGRRLKTAWLRERLAEEFPRLAGLETQDWVAQITDESGLKLTRTLPAEVVHGDQDLALPPRVKELSLKPFDLRIPFNVNVPGLFKFDAAF